MPQHLFLGRARKFPKFRILRERSTMKKVSVTKALLRAAAAPGSRCSHRARRSRYPEGCSACPEERLPWLPLRLQTWLGTSCAGSGPPLSRSAALTHHRRAWKEESEASMNLHSRVGSGSLECPQVPSPPGKALSSGSSSLVTGFPRAQGLTTPSPSHPTAPQVCSPSISVFGHQLHRKSFWIKCQTICHLFSGTRREMPAL